MGVLGASKSPYALDVCGTSLIGLKPESVLMLREAHERGLGPLSPQECRLVKEGIEPLAQPDFLKAEAASTDFIDRLPSFLRPAAKKIATPTPKIRKKECVGCGRCAESCPQHTIQIREGKAVIDYKTASAVSAATRCAQARHRHQAVGAAAFLRMLERRRAGLFPAGRTERSDR